MGCCQIWLQSVKSFERCIQTSSCFPFFESDRRTFLSHLCTDSSSRDCHERTLEKCYRVPQRILRRGRGWGWSRGLPPSCRRASRWSRCCRCTPRASGSDRSGIRGRARSPRTSGQSIRAGTSILPACCRIRWWGCNLKGRLLVGSIPDCLHSIEFTLRRLYWVFGIL